MAKVVYGPIVSDARNKIGGSVFTKVRAGSMVRRKVSPCQPRTTAQMNVRAAFTALSKLWGGSTMDANRAGWIALAASYPVKDVFGANVSLTGHQLFVKLNRNLQTVKVPTPLLIAPVSLTCPYPGELTLAHDGPPVTTLTIDQATDATAAEGLAIFATPGISAGRSSAGARFRLIWAQAGPNGGPQNFLAVYTTKFGAPATAQKIFFREVYVKLATGAASMGSEDSIVI
jgi:hypothetical protein